MNGDAAPTISESTYEWSVRVFDVLRKLVRINLKLHHQTGQIDAGDIFLFNHFARFETFIPQYLLFKETGVYCRSVASAEFFEGDDTFAGYLRRVGAVRNDHPDLFSVLVADALRGRKIIIFPEGGMVKDRRVVGPKGYSVYSRAADARRKHHSGAAVLALGLDALKHAVRHARDSGHGRRVEAWAAALGVEDPSALIDAAARPTHIVPANITFYPIRVGDNLLRKGAELLNRGLSRRMSEELLIEGNLLLRDTDMDIRLGDPVRVDQRWRWWHRRLVERVLQHMESVDQLFQLGPDAGRWDARLLARLLRRQAARIRDDAMHQMYALVTVNLSHLASCLALALLERGRESVEEDTFRRLLYLAVKSLQRMPDVHLHRSLRNPDAYAALPDGQSGGLDQFLASAEYSDLVRRADGRLHFLPKLRAEHAFDEIRLENFLEVYANEVAPVRAVRRVLAKILGRRGEVSEPELAALRFDDELIAHAWDRDRFDQPEHQAVNRGETATEDSSPFLLEPPGAGDAPAVVLVHGFLASPAEVRGFGEILESRGHTVVGVRLRGHGTSPWDLRERTWKDWLASVRRGLAMARGYARRVCLVGFSTGGALCLRLAAEGDSALAGVAGVSVPMRFRNGNMRFVPLVHGANRLVRWVSSSEGVMPFRANDSEHPQINYHQMPIRGLYELTCLVEELERTLGDVRCPVALVQSTEDPVVDPSSVDRLASLMEGAELTITRVASDRHGILYEDVGETRAAVLAFLDSLRVSGDESSG
jgi:esterase/lipase